LRHRRWKKRIASAVYELGHLRRAACLHALCEAECDAIRALGLRNPVCVIPNGVDRVPAERSVRRTLWRRDLPQDARVLLYLGRLHPKKGLANLINAWSEIRREEGRAASRWHLVIAGWDEDRHQEVLEGIVLASGVADTVHFIGPQVGPGKDATFRSSDAFILPSFSEGLPMTVLEAWAYGLPVLMTPHCNLPEGFASGAALPIEASPDGIAHQLRTVLAMPDERRLQLGAQGLKLARTRFDWGRIAGELAAVYFWVAGSAARPDSVRLA
jgi:poly(glycerol-phosphate) alpha-glucosyltransferase